MLTPIKHDLHNISLRLKSINSRYCLFRNAAKERFEVHGSEFPSFRTLCFVPPFEELDERTLMHALRTNISNFDGLESEFDAHNLELAASAELDIKRQHSLLADMMNFASSSEHEVVFQKGVKWF